MKSLVGRPKIHSAGESFVVGSGVFRYCRIGIWRASVSAVLLGPVFVSYEAPNCFDTDFSAAVQIRVGKGRYTMMNSPGFEELLCWCSGEFWATISF